jgi:hypothetical protein
MPSESLKKIQYVLISAGMKFRKKEVPVWYTGIYRPISSMLRSFEIICPRLIGPSRLLIQYVPRI